MIVKISDLSQPKNNKTVELLLNFNFGLSAVKNRRKQVRFLMQLPFGLLERKVKLFVNDNLLVNSIFNIEIFDKSKILSDLKKKKLNFDVLIADAFEIHQLMSMAKKLSTQKLMPKEELGTLVKNIDYKHLVELYNEFSTGKKNIVTIAVSNYNAILNIPIGNFNEIDSTQANLDFIMGNIIEMIYDNSNIISKKSIKIKSAFIKTTNSASIKLC